MAEQLEHCLNIATQTREVLKSGVFFTDFPKGGMNIALRAWKCHLGMQKKIRRAEGRKIAWQARIIPGKEI